MPANAFLYEVAEHAYKRFGKDLSRVAFVFPNKRPAIYLRKWLGELIEEPIWSPPMMTIHEFIFSSTHRLPADKLVSRFLLFEAYEEVFSEANEPYNNRFEDFFNFSEILLNDFTELEANGASIGDVYANLRAMGELSAGLDYLTEEQQRYLERFWSSFSIHRMSRQQEKFIRLWEKLPAIYNRFSEKLAKQGLIDTGTAYRALAAGQHDKTDFDAAYSHIAFVGFNALNQSEQKIFTNYKEAGRALFYFDADLHYIDDPLQEAGRFIRRNLQLFGNELAAGDTIRSSKKRIEVLMVEGDAAQAGLVPQLLAEIEDLKTHPEKTALLLADESQLEPVLQSLPPGIKVNITMGYALKRSVIYPLVLAYLKYAVGAAQQQNKYVFYEPVFQLLEHPWLQAYEPAVALRKQLQQEVSIRIPVSALLATGDPLLQKIFTPLTDPMALFDGIRNLLQWWSGAGNKARQTDMLRQLATAAWQQLNRLEGLLSTFSQHLSIGFVADTIQMSLFSLSVPLEGEPLEGLQIMGLLESRGLDFEQYILLQVNDGILPKRSAAPTFLPDSIRRAYQLSVLENQDSIFAYVFYRLLQRSSRAWMTYNTLVTDQSTGEPSRFLAQLAYETKMDLVKKQVSIPLKAYWKEAIQVEKTEPVLGLLKRFTNVHKKLTPTAINNYLDCRLKFYFSQLAEIKEPEVFLTELDAKTVGTIFHRVLENLYTDLVTQKKREKVDKADIQYMRAQLPTALDKAFSEVLTGTDKPFVFSGSFLVLREIIASYAKKVLAVDEVYAPFSLVSMERQLAVQVPITVSGKKEMIWLGGYVDRIDWKEGVYRIIDYKTGADERKIQSIASMFDRENPQRNKAALQTLVYAWVLQREEREKISVETGIYDVRAMGKSPEDFSWQFVLKETGTPEKIDHLAFAQYEAAIWEKLMEVIVEIFDPSIPFNQTNLVEKCVHCAYNKLCSR
ncbi:MAG: PD-(D/E)XK nuclease family protein [Bacteroidetes bacterium]|nr:PD-(D/E)XK nuclease family protein [Bacteroidota bacterium]